MAELIKMPSALAARYFSGWPEIYRVGTGDEEPPEGIPYIKAEETDDALLFRLLVPLLMKQHPYLDWPVVYGALTGFMYTPVRTFTRATPTGDGTGHSYYESSSEIETKTLEEFAADCSCYVDIDMLAELKLLPTFMEDIREAIAINVTNNYAWQDGFDKKRGICTGSLTEQPQTRNLVILDISGSIPDGVSVGMLTLIRTITDITNADLILTGSKSFFYTNAEAQVLDIRQARRDVGRNNESRMFRQILRDHDMTVYRNIITFGDSDNPGFFGGDVIEADVVGKLRVENWYSFFCMRNDTYGNHHEAGCGYGRWIKKFCPDVNVIHRTDWAKLFSGEDTRW